MQRGGAEQPQANTALRVRGVRQAGSVCRCVWTAARLDIVRTRNGPSYLCLGSLRPEGAWPVFVVSRPKGGCRVGGMAK